MDRNDNLLIIGAGVLGLVAKDIAEETNRFKKICFLDDNVSQAPNGIKVIGKCNDIEKYSVDFGNVLVAIRDAKARMQMIAKVEESACRMISLISKSAHISTSAQIGDGCIIEPTAVIGTGCVLSKGCYVCSGAIIGHISMLCEGVDVESNATVCEKTIVPAGMKIAVGTVYRREGVNEKDLFYNPENLQEKLVSFTVKVPQGGPENIEGQNYSFDDVM